MELSLNSQQNDFEVSGVGFTLTKDPVYPLWVAWDKKTQVPGKYTSIPKAILGAKEYLASKTKGNAQKKV